MSLPLELTKGECRYKQAELKRLRDERAETLGMLAEMRDLLASALEQNSTERGIAVLAEFAGTLQCVVQGTNSSPDSIVAEQSVVESLQMVAERLTPSDTSVYVSEIKARDLARPSRLTLLWPRLVLIPPLTLYLVRTAYASRASLHEIAVEAWQTMRGFWEDWLLEPLREVVKTVRTGGDDSVIITRESVKADLDVSHSLADQVFKPNRVYM